MLLLLGVAILSLIRLPTGGLEVNDKLSHLVVYAVLSGWFSLLARQRSTLAKVIVGLFLYGILIEALQYLTGYRYAEWGDVVANMLGILLGACLFFTPLVRILEFLDRKLGMLFLRD